MHESMADEATRPPQPGIGPDAAIETEEAGSDPDERGTDQIVQALAYVPWVARRYLGRGLSFEDLVAAGNLGLVQGACRFDPERNVKFLTYADWWIRKAIHLAIGEQAGPVRLPRYQHDRLRTVYSARSELRLRGTEPTPSQIAGVLGLPAEEVERLLLLIQGAISLEQPLGSENGPPLRETLSDPAPGHPIEELEREQGARLLRRHLDSLDPRERRILSLRFGLGGDAPLTLRAAGRLLGISRERVRQIELRALIKLRRLV